MTKQGMKTEVLTSPYADLLKRYGHLIWWTVHQGIYETSNLVEAAKQVSLPEPISELLTGAKGKTAWEKATNLRTQAIVTKVDPITKQQTSYTTRDAEGGMRLLIKEDIDQQNVKLCAIQVGVLQYDGGFKFEPDSPYWPMQNEVDEVLYTMEKRYYERLDRVDDTKLRVALLNWLKTHFRVPVRGNGGIYFVPRRESDERNQDFNLEVMSIKRWLDNCSLGTITAIEVTATETTTIDDIVQSAVDEIREEITEVETKLQQYRDSAGMNAGSRAEAAKSQVKRVDTLIEKIQALEVSLGEKVGMTLATAQIIANRAKLMVSKSETEVTDYRTNKKSKPRPIHLWDADQP